MAGNAFIRDVPAPDIAKVAEIVTSVAAWQAVGSCLAAGHAALQGIIADFICLADISAAGEICICCGSIWWRDSCGCWCNASLILAYLVCRAAAGAAFVDQAAGIAVLGLGG